MSSDAFLGSWPADQGSLESGIKGGRALFHDTPAHVSYALTSMQLVHPLPIVGEFYNQSCIVSIRQRYQTGSPCASTVYWVGFVMTLTRPCKARLWHIDITHMTLQL